MLNYEQLDAVADAVFPALALIGLSHIVRAGVAKQWQTFRFGLFGALYGMALAYGLRYLDIRWPHWHHLGLDYSTHSAVVLVCVVVITLMTQHQRWIWSVIGTAYACLMVYQQYHPPVDIVATVAVIGLLYGPPVWFLYQRLRSPNKEAKGGPPSQTAATGLT